MTPLQALQRGGTAPSGKRFRRGARPGIAGLLVIVLLLTGCAPLRPYTSVRPLARVGLLAPFEGLYRQRGYDALAALRATLAENPPAAPDGVALLPLALDTSMDATRAAQKLALPGDVRAAIGPFAPADVEGVAGPLRAAGIPWVAPFATGPQGFVDPTNVEWMAVLADAVAGVAAEQGADRLALAGWDGVAALRPATSVLPWVDVTGAAELRPGDALLWMGDEAEGARFIAQVADRDSLIVWLAPWAAGSVMVDHLGAAVVSTGSSGAGSPGAGSLPELFWGLWLPVDYTEWSSTRNFPNPIEFLLHRAAAWASGLNGSSLVPPAADSWQFVPFRLTEGAVSLPLR